MTTKRKNQRGGRNARAVSELPAQSASDLGPQSSLPPLLPELYINRELSWLEFNRRVLEEAADPATPLLERVKFAAIFASNLDEFFMIRVAGLKRKLAAGIAEPGPDGRLPSAAFAAVRTSTQKLLETHGSLLHELIAGLAEANVTLLRHAALTDKDRQGLQEYFERDIFPVLTPQAIDRARRFPHVSNQSLNLIVVLRSETAGQRLARIKIPAVLPRLVRIPPRPIGGLVEEVEAHRFVWLEDLTVLHLHRLFPGNDILGAYPFHVIRDSDIEIDEDEDVDHDLLSTIRELLSERTFGSVVKLTVDRSMPEDVRAWLVDQLHASERDLYVVDGPLAAEDLLELSRIERPELKDPTFVPAGLSGSSTVTALLGDGNAWAGHDIFAYLRERDVLVHHPYQTFGVVSDFLKAASTDPQVVAIKQTLYRLGRDSPLIPALIEARDDDTQVAVMVEVEKARFDEENNITWAQQLEDHGVHVAYGLAGLKTHCKATLVVRREQEGLRRYVHLSTGNYNATTARIYEDIGFFTAREDIASDVSELFNALTGYSQQEQYRKLWVAPMHLRHHFLREIEREIDYHRQTGDGYLSFKMNALVDRVLIRSLYAASQAGVKIDLLIRGVCCLRPGVPGWSETIRVRSVVGRFLEHSRVFLFRHGGADVLYLGSADLMERNLDRRVEALFPIEDETLKAHLRDHILPAYWRDTVNARELNADGRYVAVTPPNDDLVFDVQRWLMERYSDPRSVPNPG